MNNTKWEEIHLAMYALGPSAPRWRTRDIETQYVCPWDGDWFYHFSVGGYETIEWLELKIETPSQKESVLKILQGIHVPLRISNEGVMVFGYIRPGELVGYGPL